MSSQLCARALMLRQKRPVMRENANSLRQIKWLPLIHRNAYNPGRNGGRGFCRLILRRPTRDNIRNLPAVASIEVLMSCVPRVA
jgi:hypothetical protein